VGGSADWGVREKTAGGTSIWREKMCSSEAQRKDLAKFQNDW
jgi:hypothetical protein